MTSPGLAALLDQVDAAARQVQAGMHAHAVRSGWPLRNIAADPWVRRIVADVGAAALTGRLRSCRHLGSPQPAVAAAWRSGLIVCPPCARMWFDLAGTKANHLCDRCGRDTTGEGIHPGLVAAGALLLLYGCCGTCHASSRRPPDEPRPAAPGPGRERRLADARPGGTRQATREKGYRT